MVYCAICGAKTDLEYRGLCCHCLRDLAGLREKYSHCDFCGNFYQNSFDSCPTCFAAKTPKAYKKVQACYPYQGGAKDLVWDLKFHNRRYLAEPMAKLMVNTGDITEKGVYDLMIPVPLTPSRRKEREYNQAELLCTEISHILAIDTDFKTLIKIKDTPSQASLSPAKRRHNLQDAFDIVDNNDLKGRRVILVDDVITTGSTADQCARVLKRAGADSVKVLAFCGSGRKMT